MRKTFFFVMAICCYVLSQAQGEDFYNPNEAIAKIPQSPEVAAFEKFSSDINMYTGTPNISVPLYTFSGKELSLPITLSYDASGIKVDQLATQVGLGWNLNYGGVISRNVNGQPDDYIGVPDKPEFLITESATRSRISAVANSGFIHGEHVDNGRAQMARLFYIEYQKNNIDHQADTFSINVNGLSGTIVVDYWDDSGEGDYRAYFLEDPLVKVVYEVGYGSGDGFTVTDASGTVYRFSAFESNIQTTSPEGDEEHEFTFEYITAWFLTEMTSANGLDQFTFSYTQQEWADEREATPIQQKELIYNGGLPGDCFVGGTDLSPLKDRGYNKYYKTQLRLDQIIYQGQGGSVGLILKTVPATRNDLNGVSKISEVHFFDTAGGSSNGDEVLKVDFLNDAYFGGNRLMLEGLAMYRDNSAEAKEYVFDYESPTLVPARIGEYGVDFWGYYNDKANSDLAANPSFTFNNTVAHFFSDLGSFSGGADRRPVIEKAKIGTLKSISYPTGGKTQYVYEAHRDWDQKLVGGLRIQRVETYEDAASTGSPDYTTYYYYGDLYKDVVENSGSVPTPWGWPSSYPSTSVVQQDVYFSELKNIDVQNPGGECDQKMYLLTQNRAPIVPNAITYSTVTEIRYNDGTFEGCTITDFHNGYYNGGRGYADRQRPFVKTDLHFGSIESQRVYNNTLTLLQETVNNMGTKPAATTMPDHFGVVVYPKGPNDSVGGSGYCIMFQSTSSGFDYHFIKSHVGDPNVACPPLYGDGDGDGYAHYTDTQGYTYTQYWVKKESSVTISNELGQEMETVTNYAYGSTNHYLPTEVTTSDSKGGTYKSETVYSVDYAELPVGYPNTAILQQLIVNKNMKLVPVQQTKSYKEDGSASFEVLGRQWQEFKDFDPATGPENQVIKPYRVYVGKGGNDPELRMVYNQYDAYGNLVEAYYPEGTENTYIWGYEGRYLLAEIKNADHASVRTKTAPPACLEHLNGRRRSTETLCGLSL